MQALRICNCLIPYNKCFDIENADILNLGYVKILRQSWLHRFHNKNIIQTRL